MYPHEVDDPVVVIPIYKVPALIDRLNALMLEARGYDVSRAKTD